MIRRVNLIWILLALTSAAVAQTTTSVSRNDHIFPSGPAAKPSIDFDRDGFLVQGKRTFIVSAGMEYARVPRGLWRDRLLKLKAAGFNAIEIYTFWNYHEPQEGKFDFSGDHDLNAFLKLVHELDMYAIVRVGPYYCAEWNFGGYPIWLKFKAGLRVREDNPQFLNAVSAFFEKLLPVVSKNQIHKGGPVIMVQLENEHTAGWGDMLPNNYFKFLQNKLITSGIQVPYYFSGLHPGNDPAGTSVTLDDPTRPNPWFSAEYWGVWFFNYGPQRNDVSLYDRRTWKIISRGGNGYNVYMAHGGTNFGYHNDRDMAASYDYGAAVGQTGDLRPLYYVHKRAALFARSFENILEHSKDASFETPLIITDTAVTTIVRTGPNGTIVFLDNRKNAFVHTTVKAPVPFITATDITLKGGEILPMIQNFKLTPEVSILWAPSRIYNIVRQENITNVILSGAAGSVSKIYLRVPSQLVSETESVKRIAPEVLEVTMKVTTLPSSRTITIGKNHIRIIALTDDMADRSWQLNDHENINLIIGSAYPEKIIANQKSIELTTQKSWIDTTYHPVIAYRSSRDSILLSRHQTPAIRHTKLALTPWLVKNASQPVSPDFNDDTWLASEQPIQMGADKDITANAWYRTHFTVRDSGTYTLSFKNIRDRATVFLNGERISELTTRKKTAVLKLLPNTTQQLTLFTAHDGRNKQIFYVGPADSIDQKGITGPVTLRNINSPQADLILKNWKMKGGPEITNTKAAWSSTYPDSTLHSPHFFQSSFSIQAQTDSRPMWRFITAGLGHGSVWINGHNLGRYPEKIKINGLYIPETWLKQGKNTILIYDEDGKFPHRVSIEAESAASRDIVRYKAEKL